MEPVTLKKKILLHLLDYMKIREQLTSQTAAKFEAPFEISQEGIAELFDVRQAHVSRAMKELETDGIVTREKVYIRGSNRMLTGYLLTYQGQGQAQDLRKKVDSSEIKFIDESGTGKKITTGKLAEKLAGKLKYMQIINGLTEEGVFDIRVAGRIPPEGATKPIDYADKVLEIKYFFGRAGEIELFKEWLKSPTYKILSIRGIAGIGKTTLMAKLVADLKQDRNIFWYRVHEWSSLRNMLEHISEFLAQLGKKQLSTYLATREILDIEELIGVLELDGLNALLVFDNYQKARDELVQFLSAFKEMLEQVDGTKVVVSSRYTVPFYDRRDVLVKKVVQELELEGLDEESSKEVLRLKGLEQAQWERIFRLTRGHPLLLEIIKSAEDIDSGGDLKKFLQEEILSGLSDGEKNILYVASVFRFPFYPRAFFADEEIDYDTIDRLVEKSLLQAAGSTYDIHDVIKEFFYRRLTPAQKKANHAIAAKYYLEESGELASVEALYHLLRSGEHRRAAEVGAQSGSGIIAKGYLEEFMSLLDEFDEKSVGDDALWTRVLVFKGDILSVWGEWEKAISVFEKALDYSKKAKDTVRTAEINRKIGSVYDKDGQAERAMEHYNIALKWLGDSLDTVEVAKILGGIGSILMKQGKYDKAIEYLMKDLEVAERTGDRREKSQVFHNLGIVYFHTGDQDKALDCNLKSLALMEELGDVWGIGTSYTNIANIYMKREDLKNALDYNLKSLAVRQNTGDIWGISTCYNNIGNVYYRLRDLDHAIEFYQKSQEIFERLGDNRGVIATCNNLGLIWFEKGDMKEALRHYNHCLDMLRKYGDERNIAATCGNLGMVYLSMGDTGRALECYQTSLKSFQRLKDSYCEAVSHNNMGNIYFQTAELDEATKCYEKSLGIFEKLSDAQGTSTTYHNLGLTAMEKKEYERANQYFEKSLKLKEGIRDVHGVISSLNALALSHAKNGDVKNALEFCERALSYATQFNMGSVTAETQRTFAVIHAMAGDAENGGEFADRALSYFENAGNDLEVAKTNMEYGIALKEIKNRNANRYLRAALRIYEKLKKKKEIDKIKPLLE